MTSKNFIMKNVKLIQWLPVVIIIGLGIFLRWRNNFSTDLVPGINGGYYPFQIKNILQGNGLGFKDMPLLFLLEVLLAKILTIWGNHDINSIIISSTKIVDAVIPPLIALPTFFFALRISNGSQRKNFFYYYILVAFSVLYLSFIAILGSDFQKNAVGLVWVMFFLYFFYNNLIRNSRNDKIFAIIFLGLTLLTHIGCFGALLCFLLLYGIFYLIGNVSKFNVEKRYIFITAIVAIVSFIGLFLIDEKRFDRLASFFLSPTTFFESPIILFMLDKQPIIQGIWLLNFLACNILVILGLIYLLIRKKRIEKKLQFFVFSIVAVCLFLTSPFLGIEWAERFLWIAPVFIIIEYLFIFSVMQKKIVKVSTGVFLILLIVYSFRPATRGKRPHISKESYEELFIIDKKMDFGENSIILTRHGLEWWTGFILDTKVGQDYSLTKEEFTKYDKVFVLRQKQGNNFTMLAWSHFLEVEIPDGAIPAFKGEYFDLFEITEPLNYTKESSRPPDTYGVIRQIQENEFLISNERYSYKVRLNPKTEICFKTDFEKLQEGMNVELWGKRKPFSLEIIAETIHQIDGKKI